MTRSKNVKCGKVKFFMRLLAMQGYIEKTLSSLIFAAMLIVIAIAIALIYSLASRDYESIQYA